MNSQKQKDITEFTDMLLTALSPKEERVLRLRYGFSSGSEQSVAEIARSLHVSKSTVEQIEARALRKLRSPTQLLTSSLRSVADLRRALDIFERILQEDVTTDEVASTIERELPELSSLAATLPRNRVELYAFIQTIVIVLSLIVSGLNKPQSTSVQVNQTTNIVITQPEKKEIAKPTSKAIKKASKARKKKPRKCP